MALRTTTDPAGIDRVLDAAVAADPVRNTVLGSVRASTGARWAAWDGVAVAARSAPHLPVALSVGWTDAGELAGAIGALDSVAGLGGPPELVDALVAHLAREVVSRVDERLYRLDELTGPAGVPGAATAATHDDWDLLVAWFDAFLAEAFGAIPDGHDSAAVVSRSLDGTTPPFVWRVSDAAPVAMAAARDSGAGVHRIGPVYTPPALRGRGYGSAVTAAATQRVLAAGAIPVLYTDLANATSNAIYQRLGYRPVADRAAVTIR